MTTERGRFPLGLTVATAIALAILITLGVWQVKRLAWKTDMLARIEALQHAPAQPLDQALAGAAGGQDVEFAKVSVDCPGLASAAFEQVYALVDGQVAYRLVSACQLSGGGAILVDRGYVLDSVAARPAVVASDEPVHVRGDLRKGDKKPARSGPPMQAGEGQASGPKRVWYGRDVRAMAQALGVKSPAAYFLMAETSTNPEFPALKAAPVPTDIPNNHLSYAMTWFGLAAGLVGVYAALLRKKLQGR